MTPTKLDAWYNEHADAVRLTAWGVAGLIVAADVAVVLFSMVPLA